MAESTEKVCCICLNDVLFQKSGEPSFNPGCCGQTFHMSCTVSLIKSFKFTKPTCPYCRAYLKTDWIFCKCEQKTFSSQCYYYIYDKWLDLRYFLVRNETPMAFFMGSIYSVILFILLSKKTS